MTETYAGEATATTPDWLIYRGTRKPHDELKQRLPAPPPWRAFDGHPLLEESRGSEADVSRRFGELARAATYKASDPEVEMVNAALYLRRPLLVTGKPGTGKSTLAHSVARELKLGPVLYWPITSRSDRLEGLYQYDAIARLQDAGLQQQIGSTDGDHPDLDIGRYIRLGPLGTALLAYEWPRVLLIDELDKSDIDLPNDLLTLFETGEYEIRELSRIAQKKPTAEVLTHDGTDPVIIEGGKVRCRAFPLVIITSNEERDFPPPFMRRCLRLRIQPPDPGRLAAIVRAHLGDEAATQNADLIQTFWERQQTGDLATDQLLNAIFLTQSKAWPDQRQGLIDAVMQYLSGSSPS
ncbi:MAG: AAA family ATPase [Streptosporangiaceae bacterium]